MACQKKVHDFTRESDRYILEKIRSEEKICGRFLPSQLDRPLLEPSHRLPTYLASVLGLLGFFSLGSQQASAQQIKGDTVTMQQHQVVGKMIAKPAKVKIQGSVFKQGKPCKGVKISVNGDVIDTITDKNGQFTVTCHLGDILVIYPPRMQSIERKIQSAAPLHIDLEPEKTIYVLGGLGVSGIKPETVSRFEVVGKIKKWFT